MSFPIKAGLLAASAALLLAFGGSSLVLHLMQPGVTPPPLFTASVLSPVAAVVAFVAVATLVRRRLGRSKPVLGAVRGALLAVAIFALTVLFHATLYPGAAGVAASFVGQFLFAFLVAGIPAAVVGALMGACIDRLAEAHGT